jgi:hypothetical protein
MLATVLSSLVGYDAAEATWPWRDVAAESSWQWCYQGNIGRGTMSLLSHAGDGAAESCWR